MKILIISNMEAIEKKTTIAQAEEWWGQTDFGRMERITGFEYHNFDCEYGYQDFVDACNDYWNERCSEEKIEIRKNHA
jgi:hypothetical protein